MRYLDPSFSLSYGGTDAYRDGWERTFGAKPASGAPPCPFHATEGAETADANAEDCFDCRRAVADADKPRA